MKNQSGPKKDPQSQENKVEIVNVGPTVIEEDSLIQEPENKHNVPKNKAMAFTGEQQINIQSLMNQATANGNVEMAEKMLDLYERLEKKWAKQQFDKAMAKFQLECPIIKKTKIVFDKGGKERYRFAPLDSIVEQAGPFISKNGLSYTIKVRHDDKMMTIIVTVKHVAGHSEDSEFSIPIGSEEYMSEPQKYGARCTFAKRYAFCNAFGILTGDGDTDAVEAEKDKKHEPVRPAAPNKPAPNLIQTPLLNKLKKKLHDKGADTGEEAVKLLEEITGLKWQSMKATEKQAEIALAAIDKKEKEEAASNENIPVIPIEDLPDMVPENPKERFSVSGPKIEVMKGLFKAKKEMNTEEEIVKYINAFEGVNNEFPKRRIIVLEDLNMDEADKIIRFMTTSK